MQVAGLLLGASGRRHQQWRTQRFTRARKLADKMGSDHAKMLVQRVHQRAARRRAVAAQSAPLREKMQPLLARLLLLRRAPDPTTAAWLELASAFDKLQHQVDEAAADVPGPRAPSGLTELGAELVDLQGECDNHAALVRGRNRGGGTPATATPAPSRQRPPAPSHTAGLLVPGTPAAPVCSARCTQGIHTQPLVAAKCSC